MEGISDVKNKSHTTNVNVQHRGVGKRLMAKAELIAKENGYKKIAVISGIGVKEYYKKLNFYESIGKGKFMIKVLDY